MPIDRMPQREHAEPMNHLSRMPARSWTSSGRTRSLPAFREITDSLVAVRGRQVFPPGTRFWQGCRPFVFGAALDELNRNVLDSQIRDRVRSGTTPRREIRDLPRTAAERSPRPRELHGRVPPGPAGEVQVRSRSIPTSLRYL